MAGNRSGAEKFILEYIEKLLPGSENTQYYKDLFASMDDKAFEGFIAKLESGDVILPIIAPNLNKSKLQVERNLKLAKELGHNFFERIWIDSGGDVPRYLSDIAYLVVVLPLRRQAQLLVKKISIPEDNSSTDDFTGQPTGKSKGSKISYPEIQILAALGLDNCMTEWLKYRGGDVKGMAAMNDMVSKTGGVSLERIASLGTKVESTKTLNVFFTSMHLQNTLLA